MPEPIRIYCPCCTHLYSIRAPRCPKCNWVNTGTCSICQTTIPRQSTSCPECGDPEPFSNDSSIASGTIGGDQCKLSTHCQSTSPVGARKASVISKRSHSYVRWAIIFGTSIAAMAVVATIQDIRGESSYAYSKRNPERARNWGIGISLAGTLAGVISYRLTKRYWDSNSASETAD